MSVTDLDLQQLVLAAFAEQASEQMATLGGCMRALETVGERGAVLEEILRQAHSLKGAARAAELARVEDAAHRLESLAAEPGTAETIETALKTLARRIEEDLDHATAERPQHLPLSALFDTLPGQVEDLANELGKQVSLQTEGGRIVLDRRLLDRLRSPLTHMIRNCVDHGIESPYERVAAGKGAEGHVLVRARLAATTLVIELRDDGAGIDAKRLKARAVAGGILTAEAAERLSPHQAAALIFSPGLSTSTDVTHLSGRGVGLDAARREIERLGGAIDVESTPGLGTKLTLSVPLAAA
jgi:two-component system, chemotaxis family, sensor kinase CheA